MERTQRFTIWHHLATLRRYSGIMHRACATLGRITNFLDVSASALPLSHAPRMTASPQRDTQSEEHHNDTGRYRLYDAIRVALARLYCWPRIGILKGNMMPVTSEAFRIRPCVEDESGNVRRPELFEAALFWGIYYTAPNGLETWVDDCDTLDAANARVAVLIEEIHEAGN